MNKNSLIKLIFLLALWGIIYPYFNGVTPSWAAEWTVGSLKRDIPGRQRPRVVYIFSNGCGACKRYGPVLKSAVATYSNYFDFQSMNVSDRSYAKLLSQYHINSVPATFMFNKSGWPVFAVTGCTDRKMLDNGLRSAYASTVVPLNKTVAASKTTKGGK